MPKNLKTLATLPFLVILTACETIEVAAPLPCPAYPELETIDPELAEETPQIVRTKVQENYLRLDTYIRKLEARAGCE